LKWSSCDTCKMSNVFRGTHVFQAHKPDKLVSARALSTVHSHDAPADAATAEQCHWSSSCTSCSDSGRAGVLNCKTYGSSMFRRCLDVAHSLLMNSSVSEHLNNSTITMMFNSRLQHPTLLCAHRFTDLLIFCWNPVFLVTNFLFAEKKHQFVLHTHTMHNGGAGGRSVRTIEEHGDE
jgi:hypothetical protein